MSRHDLDLWPLDLELLQHFECHAFKLCRPTKFQRNRVIQGLVIDDLARFIFRLAVLGSGARFTDQFSGVRWPNLMKLGRGIGQSFLHNNFVSDFRYLVCCILKRVRLKLSDVLNDAKFRTFWPPPLLLKPYLQPNLRNTFDGHPLRGCWARLSTHKKEKNKEKVHG